MQFRTGRAVRQWLRARSRDFLPAYLAPACAFAALALSGCNPLVSEPTSAKIEPLFLVRPSPEPVRVPYRVAYVRPPIAPSSSVLDFAQGPEVQVLDQMGDPYLTSPVRVQLAIYTDSECLPSKVGDGAMAVSQNPVFTDGQGKATFSGIRYSKVGLVYVGVSAPGLKTACSSGIVVPNTPPLLPALPDRLYPLGGAAGTGPLEVGLPSETTWSFAAADPDVGQTMAYTCQVQSVGLDTNDKNYVAPSSSCAVLSSLARSGTDVVPGSAIFRPTTGELVWWPYGSQRGTYKFTVGVNDGAGGVDSRSFHVTLRQGYSPSSLTLALDAEQSAAFATVSASAPSIPRDPGGTQNDRSPFIGLIGGLNGDLGLGTATPWLGTGVSLAQTHRLSFSGGTEKMTFTSDPLVGATRMRFQAWVQPAASPVSRSTVLSNSLSGGTGFELRQRNTYKQVILADNPVHYLRLDEASGTVAANLGSAPVAPGQYLGGYTMAQAGALKNDATGSTLFNGSTAYVQVLANGSTPTGNAARTYEAWVNPTGNGGTIISIGAAQVFPLQIFNSAGTWYLFSDGVNGANNITLTGSEIPPLGVWSMLHFTYDGAQHWKFYVNGQLLKSGTFPIAISTGGSLLQIGSRSDGGGGGQYYSGRIDEVAVYGAELSPTQIREHYDAGVAAFGLDLRVSADSNYKSIVLDDAPTGFWRLGEASGATTAVDETASPANGTYNSTTLGSVASAHDNEPGTTVASFTGAATSYVAMGTPAKGSFATEKFTFEFWMKANDRLSKGVIGKGSGPWEYAVYDTGTGSLTLATWPSNGACSQWVIAMPYDLSWGHYVFTSDGKHARAYRNGVLISTVARNGACATAMSATAAPMRIGSAAESIWRYLNGALQDVAVYDYALSAGQIRRHYDAGYQRFPPSRVLSAYPLGYWRLGERSGTIARDFSGNNRHGAYTGGVTLGKTGAIGADVDTAVQLDGSTGSVQIPHDSGLNALPLSVSFWTKFTATPLNSGLVTKYVASSLNGWSTHVNGSGAACGWYYVSAGNDIDGLCTPAINDGQWHHVVAVFSQGGGKIYSDGTLRASVNWAGTAGPATSTTPINLGVMTGGGGGIFNGSLDEAAVYDSALSDLEVSRLYSQGQLRRCVSQDNLVPGTWASLGGLWDGTKLSLMVNGNRACGATPLTPSFSPASGPLTFGASADGTRAWTGDLSALRVYASDNSGDPGSVNVGLNDYFVTADRFRKQPLGSTVTQGLVAILDAANASLGTGTYGQGCANDQLRWTGAGPLGLAGDLLGFLTSDCVGVPLDGWQGMGTTIEPYRLALDGTNDYVSLGNAPDLRVTGPLTLEAWVRPTSVAVPVPDTGIAGTGISTGYQINWAGDTGFTAYIGNGSNKLSVAVPSNRWHQVVITWDGTNMNDFGMTLYSDGRVAATGKSTVAGPLTSFGPFWIGRSTNYFKGQVARVSVYNRAITPQEVNQNCHALSANYGVNCP